MNRNFEQFIKRLRDSKNPVGILAFVVFAISGCTQSKTLTWREEVELVQGAQITVECTNEYKKIFTGNESAWQLQTTELITNYPATNLKIYWKKTVQPLVLDFDKNGTPYIVATIRSRPGEIDYPNEKGIFVAFKYSEKNSWIQIPIGSVPNYFKRNMLVDPLDTFTRMGYPSDQTISLKMKKKLNSDPRFAVDYSSWLPK